MMRSDLRVALVTPGWTFGGGVPSVARFFLDGLREAGVKVCVFDLAVSRADATSTRILKPSTWFRGPSVEPLNDSVDEFRAGAHMAELEIVRYLPRDSLTRKLKGFDLIQVVAGTPAWATVVQPVDRPRILQVATTTAAEREHQHRHPTPGGLYRAATTALATRLDAAGLKLVDHVLVENSAMRDYTLSVTHESQKVSLIHPGVDTAIFRRHGEWSGTRPLISVGRLGDARKGWQRLISSYKCLVDQDPATPTLRIVGRGPVPPGMNSLVNTLDLSDRVEILPDVGQDSLVALLQSSSIFVQLSYEEGLGIAALEAMACGLPVVATETAGSREYVIPGRTGALLAQDDAALPEAFARAVGELLSEPTGKTSRLAQELVNTKFAQGPQFDRILALYHALLQ